MPPKYLFFASYSVDIPHARDATSKDRGIIIFAKIFYSRADCLCLDFGRLAIPAITKVAICFWTVVRQLGKVFLVPVIL